KGYYPMYWCGMFYDCQHDVPITQKPERIYGLCGVNEGKILATLTYYAYEEDLPSKTLKVDFGREGTYEVYLLDEKHDGTLWKTTSDLTFEMPLYTSLLIKEI
ncbi:MAG: hypothetical protein IKB23_00115, partial [Clostridia bacterium]|nr:hypothetical protein [Clostridia bacterium]